MLYKILLLRLWLIVTAISTCLPAFAQENIGFEKGNFDNWDFAVGKIDEDGTITTYNSFAVPGCFTLLKNNHTNLRDDYGNFSVFSPNGGQYSVKLGNTVNGNGAQQMSYNLTVPPAGANSIIFDYAMVLVSTGHPPEQEPRFQVKIYNITDDKYLSCPSFDFAASANLPGFKVTSDSILYKDWSSASIKLTGLNNKKIRLEFTVNHCPFGYHFAYAYIDVKENIGEPIAGNSYCSNQGRATLSAPPGFASYTWYTGDFKTKLDTGQNLSLQAPNNQQKLAVIVKPYNGLGCADTLYTTINAVNSTFKFVAKEAITGCPGSSVDLTAANVTTGSSAGLTLEYLTEAYQPLGTPYNITQSGRYYIRATNAGGCSDLLPVTITFGLPELKVISPAAVTYPQTVDISKTFTQQPDITYSYYTNEAATQPLANYTAIQTSATYFIKAETANGCTTIAPVTVTVQPPPPFTITAPNTFTPNNDGINDYFLITLKGNVNFTGLDIYNRNGTRVFHSTNAGQFWDGTYNGRPLPTGTYYWVLEAYDTYYHKTVSDAAFITVIR